MKSLKNFIYETIDDINKYYIDVDTLKDGQEIFVGVVPDYAKPMKVVVKVHDKETVFVNSDDDREIYQWTDLINSKDQNEEKEQIAVFKDMKEAKKFCEYYNDIYDM